ncbi:hypothetical protein PV08_04049 [Exophiala spinifera]|uniref:Transcription factor domain-containing protein n=1 Tax=Exophiala spinifera TaxID=91928 RepID=A0A0D2BZT1_9EURO|nr:uncharacterized protein PV08_04049 [Exophiala spinifera]KIW16859.1 hypothetical protein PV08_04049 [Exophiala spinifera]
MGGNSYRLFQWLMDTRRVAELEEKIDKLTNLLTADQSPQEQPNRPDVTINHHSLPTPPLSVGLDSRPLTTATGGSCASAGNINQKGKPCIDEDAVWQTDIKSIFRTTVPPVVEERLFSDFRTTFNRYFPYVVIPPHETTASIRKEKPFLFRTCVSVACHADPVTQSQLAEELLRYIGERMLIKSEKSLDILQGLLVFISWYQHYNHYNQQMMNLLHLASAMTIDLGLNRPTYSGPWPPIGMVVDTHQLIHGKPLCPGVQTSDERRALLGLYFFHARLSACFSRIDFMQWTQHIEDCCTSLLTSCEYPSDVEAVQGVRLTRLLERYSPYTGAISLKNVPIKTFVDCFQEDLHRVKREFPANLAHDPIFQMQIYDAELTIYETVAASERDAPLERAEALHAALGTIDNLIGTFAKVSAGSIPQLPFLSWIYVLHCYIVLAKLSFLVVDGWDLQYVRTGRINFPEMISRIVEVLEAAVRHSMGEKLRPNAISARYTKYAEKMRACSKWYNSKLKAETESSVDDLGSALPALDSTFEGFFEGFNDGFWTDISMDWAGTGMQL